MNSSALEAKMKGEPLDAIGAKNRVAAGWH
jgi:hypothetical protein